VVLQKSLREGFGLTVTEAMVAGPALIGTTTLVSTSVRLRTI
jgi:hypothetical protein